jgi:glycosyltransferase involved in cell wall biosynthesis
LAETIYCIPLSLLAIAWSLQLYYLLAVYLKLRNYVIPDLDEERISPPLSVVICARNEEENLSQFLPLVLEQDYPDFEVVVVNDCSSDDSEWLLKVLAEKYSQLNVVNIKEHPRYKHGKKFAVTIGIKAAKNNCMVFTDADCKPASNQWLKHMGNSFKPGIEIVLGYSPYFKLRGFLNKNIRFETFHTAISYLSYSLKRRSYMGVGRNLAYTKTLFFEGKGFASHMHIPSGDDDLFVNQNATSTNTAICIHPESQVWSAPKESFSEYSSQKLRHHGASKAYKAGHKRMLSTQLISALLFYGLLIAAFFIYPEFWEFLLVAYLLRLLIQVIVYQPIMKKLQTLDVLAYLPILDFIYYFNTCVNGVRSLFTQKIKWK